MEAHIVKMNHITVKASDFETLVAFSKSFSGPRGWLIKDFVYEGQPLTKTQLRQLPKSVLAKLVCAYSTSGPFGDTQAFLEGLFRLEDPRN